MNTGTYHNPEREAQQAHTSREELVERTLWILPQDGVIEPLPGLHLAR